MSVLNELRIPRWFEFNESSEVDLIIFSDASLSGFGALAYARTFQNDKPYISLISSKSRVCPVSSKMTDQTKQLTIPKKELFGIELMADLLCEILQLFSQFKTNVYLFSDSTIAISWCKELEPDNRYVRRKVRKIQEKIQVKNLHHCASEDNPADLVSRGLSPSEFLKSSIWFNGPSWLTSNN